MIKDYDEPLRVQQVCNMLGIHKTTCYDLIKEGELDAYTVGKKHGGIRVLRSTVEEYKKKNKIFS